MRETKVIRLFFALWPDENVRQEISNFLKLFPVNNGRIVPRYNWHMTLHFIGNTTFAEKDCLDRQARMADATPFNLCIDRAGYFKKPKVFWLGCQHPPDALFDLHKSLGSLISECEYQPETRPYSPHITLVRKVPEKPEITPLHSIDWHVDRFVLIESVVEPKGVRYQVLEEYLLG